MSDELKCSKCGSKYFSTDLDGEQVCVMCGLVRRPEDWKPLPYVHQFPSRAHAGSGDLGVEE